MILMFSLLFVCRLTFSVGETFWDKLKIHKWYSTENYANDIVLIKLNQQDKDKKCAILSETFWDELKN